MTFFAETFEETDIPDSPTICKESFEVVARIVLPFATIWPNEESPTPAAVELIIIDLPNVSVVMVILLPGIIDKVSDGEVANIKDELALMVANDCVEEPVEILAIEPLACL